MKSRFHLSLPGLCMIVWGLSEGFAPAQQVPSPATTGVMAGSVQAVPIHGVQGLPYSRERVTVTTQTLADGTTITHQNRILVYRDSEGRTREEFFMAPPYSAEPADTPTHIHILDPVAGVHYELNPQNHTARLMKMAHTISSTPRPTNVAIANPKSAAPAHPQPVREDLGTQVIEGIEAKGTRTTFIIPVGAQGNDRPMQSTNESWYSPELRVTLMSAHKDPRSGESVTHLTHISRDEPPAELFQVPPNYAIEETRTVVPSPARPE